MHKHFVMFAILQDKVVTFWRYVANITCIFLEI